MTEKINVGATVRHRTDGTLGVVVDVDDGYVEVRWSDVDEWIIYPGRDVPLVLEVTQRTLRDVVRAVQTADPSDDFHAEHLLQSAQALAGWVEKHVVDIDHIEV